MRLTKASHHLLVSALERDHVHVQAYHYRFVQEHADALLHEVGQGLNELPVPLPPPSYVDEPIPALSENSIPEAQPHLSDEDHLPVLVNPAAVLGSSVWYRARS